MRRIFLLLIFAVSLFASCDNSIKLLDKVDTSFTGNLLLNDSIISHDVRCELKINKAEGVVTIYGTKQQTILPLEGVKLAGLRPISDGYGYLLSGVDVLPVVGDSAREELKMSLVEGKLDGAKFVIKMQMSQGELVFTNDVSATYVGALDVDGYERTVEISLTENVFDSTVEIFFDNVKFAALMPVTVDIILKDIPCTSLYDFQFSAKNVVPYINKEPDPKPAYKFGEIYGGVAQGKLWLYAKMADDLKPSRAGKEFSFKGEKKND